MEKQSGSAIDHPLLTHLVALGVPIESLPRLVEVKESTLGADPSAIKDRKVFYLCVCNSGHKVRFRRWDWSFSKWTIRVIGGKVWFFKGDWKFDFSQIPIFKDTIFVVSRRTKINEIARNRSDVLLISNNKKELSKAQKRPETNRKTKKNVH